MSDLNQKYKLAYVEVLEIIKNMPIEMRILIPKIEMDVLNEAKDKNYTFIYNSNLSLEEQEISEEAKATLVYLYQKYIKNKV